jgi:membrane associated rhomboid family serine protease
MRRQSSSMVVTQAIFALNVLVFVAMLLTGGQEIGALGANFEPATVGYNLFFGAIIAHTDNAAHIGGLLMGLLLGALIARVAPQSDDVGRRVGVLFVGLLWVFAGAIWLRHLHPVLK